MPVREGLERRGFGGNSPCWGQARTVVKFGMKTLHASEILDARFPARRLLNMVGDKWKPIVLYCLSGGVRRFNELQRQIRPISKKVLMQVLRSLEKDGLVERTVYPGVPPKTEHRLTDDGR